MGSYNIYLGDLGNSNLSDSEKATIKSTLEGWFGKIVDAGDTAIVNWVTAEPASIQEHELLVYFVGTRSSTILKFMPGSKGGGTDNGYTAFGNSITGSEVYVSNSRTGLAQIAFHELMHNKLQLDDANLHKKDGLAKIPIPPSGSPSDKNNSDMKAALKNKNKQWTGGWLASKDPMNTYT